jgi:hypothetical protein
LVDRDEFFGAGVAAEHFDYIVLHVSWSDCDTKWDSLKFVFVVFSSVGFVFIGVDFNFERTRK